MSQVNRNTRMCSVWLLQRIPRSALSPIYKLSLPHKFVMAHMSDLVDGRTFELASSATTRKVWYASIAPRRNRARREYCLQVRSRSHAHNAKTFCRGTEVEWNLLGKSLLDVVGAGSLISKGTVPAGLEAVCTSAGNKNGRSAHFRHGHGQSPCSLPACARAGRRCRAGSVFGQVCLLAAELFSR